MEARIALDDIVEDREYFSKLGTALDAAVDKNNIVRKKQIFELLAALCAHKPAAYKRAIETLEIYKNLKAARYRFKIVVSELEKATNVDYQVAVLTFINAVVISTKNLQDRIRIRNEFIGLKILPLLNNLRKVAQSVGDIIVQLDVFDQQRECDEAQSLQGPDGINLNSHLDVFYAILRQVAETPQEVPFLSILQHLLRIDPKDPVSDVIWETTEKLVHRATLLESHDDSERLLRTTNSQKFACPHCRGDATSPNRKQSVVAALSTSSSAPKLHNGPMSPLPQSSLSNTKLAPPPLVILNGNSNVPCPPPLPKSVNGNNNVPCPPPPPLPPAAVRDKHSCPAPPAPPPPAPNGLMPNLHATARSIPPVPMQHAAKLLPQQDTPAPKTKMKTLNWGKIPPQKVIGKENIWTIVANNHQHSPMTDIDWTEMEGLFCLQSTSTQGSPKLGREGYDTLDRKSKKESTEITLLDGKRSLNVNIFLKQFKTSNEKIIQLICQGQHMEIGAEKLRGLLKILPEVDELDNLKSYNGDKSRLGHAEKFLLQLLEVPNYKLRIESMLLKEEFAVNVGYLQPCINAMIFAGDDLMENKLLQEVLYMVVIAGNFLNSGGYAGNAVGVKLASLQKLTDIRANKPGMNLIHFVALQAEKRDPLLLKFTSELNALENATKTTSEQINNEIKTLDDHIQKIAKQIELTASDDDIKEQMFGFLQSAEEELTVLKADMMQVECVRLKLAEFFCEDPATFRLEECFKIFKSFCDKFNQAVKDNAKRVQFEEQQEVRRKQREEQKPRRDKRPAHHGGTPVSDTENQFLVDPTDPRASPAFARRYASLNNGGGEALIRMESNDSSLSPEITPNPIRRRRSGHLEGEDDRSRPPEGEDDLMNFLRVASKQDNISRVYGSLDRSWATRRKRPDLLNVDFSGDRERASSPAPVLQLDKKLAVTTLANGTTFPSVHHQTNEDVKPRISKNVENWMQWNENYEKQNEEYNRKSHYVKMNRRSFECDTDSERKLHTLPEEKSVPTTPASVVKGTTSSTTSSNNYKRVYPDWKPKALVNTTDVVGTIQTISDKNTANCKTPQIQRQISNQNNNRKHGDNANETNNQSTAEEPVQYRRQRSVEKADHHATPLQSIAEDEQRKSYIQKLGERSAFDRLKIYIRRPSQNDAELMLNDLKPKTPIVEATKTPPTTPRSSYSPTSIVSKTSSELEKPKTDDTFASLLDHHKSHNEKYSRKEIDADNIETPPVSRRALTTNPNISKVQLNGSVNHDRVMVTNENIDQDASGYFDRHSLTRRTIRYKRSIDYSSGNEELKDSFEKSNSNNSIQHSESKKSIVTASVQPTTITIPEKTITKLEKVGRHISSINQEDVREAIRNLKSPTGTPERIWSPPREIMNLHAQTTQSNDHLIKTSNHELNDEGFEETQSLVSDTASHDKDSTNSSCNEANELPMRPQPQQFTKQKTTTTVTKAPISKLAERLQITNLRNKLPAQRTQAAPSIQQTQRRIVSGQTPGRAVPVTNGPASSSAAAYMRNYTTSAMRRAKTTANTSISVQNSSNTSPMHTGGATSGKRDAAVERSSSRNSLRSSRSSINSGVSTNTVRRMPIVVNKQPLLSSQHTTVSVDSSPSKRPLATQNTRSSHGHNTRTGGGVPASRSSSSGSSVGQSVIILRKAAAAAGSRTNLGSTSFKENQTQSSSTPLSRINVRGVVPIKTASMTSNNAVQQISKSNARAGFMRPTAASSTKRNK